MMKARILLLILLSSSRLHGQARVADAYGSVEKRINAADTRWQPVSVGDQLGAEASIRTGGNAAALLVFPDKHAFRVGERTEVQLKEVGQNSSFSFEVLRGEIWSFVNKAKKPAKYEVETPSTVLGVSGTLFSVEHDDRTNESEISVVDGEVAVGRGNARQQLRKGFQVRMRQGSAPAFRAEKMDKHAQQIWTHLRKSENWTKGNSSPKINRQTEERIRNLKEQKRQQQQVKTPANAKQPKPPKKSKPQSAKKRAK